MAPTRPSHPGRGSSWHKHQLMPSSRSGHTSSLWNETKISETRDKQSKGKQRLFGVAQPSAWLPAGQAVSCLVWWTVRICCAIIKQEQWLTPELVTSWVSYCFQRFTGYSRGSRFRQIKAGSRLVFSGASLVSATPSASPFDVRHAQLLPSNWPVWLFSKLNIQNNLTDSPINTQTHNILRIFSMWKFKFPLPTPARNWQPASA